MVDTSRINEADRGLAPQQWDKENVHLDGIVAKQKELDVKSAAVQQQLQEHRRQLMEKEDKHKQQTLVRSEMLKLNMSFNQLQKDINADISGVQRDIAQMNGTLLQNIQKWMDIQTIDANYKSLNNEFDSSKIVEEINESQSNLRLFLKMCDQLDGDLNVVHGHLRGRNSSRDTVRNIKKASDTCKLLSSPVDNNRNKTKLKQIHTNITFLKKTIVKLE